MIAAGAARLRDRCGAVIVPLIAVFAGLPAQAQVSGLSSWQGYATNSPLSAPYFPVPGAQPLTADKPPVYTQFGVEGREAWTDNVYLVAAGTPLNGGRFTDSIKILSPSVVTVVATRTLDLAVNYVGNYDWYRANPQLNGMTHTGLATAKAELLPKEFYIDAVGSISEQPINPSGVSAADTRTQYGNRTETLAYQVGPRWQEELFDGIVSQALVSYGANRNFTPPPVAEGPVIPVSNTAPSNADQGHARLELRNSGSSSAWQWTWSSDDSETLQSGQTLRQLVNQLASELRIDEDWGLLGAVGDEQMSGDGIDPRLSGLFFNGGIHWSPSPNTELRLVDGHRAGAADLHALLTHKIGPRTDFRLARSVSISNDPSSLFKNLNGLQHDPQGGFIDPFSGLPGSATSSLFQLSNSVYREENLSILLSHGDPIDSLTISADLDSRTALSDLTQPGSASLTAGTIGEKTTDLRVSARWSHRVSPSATFSAILSDTEALSQGPAIPNSKTLSAQLAWIYAINPQMNFSVNFRLNDTLQQDVGGQAGQSSIAQGRVKEDYAYIGLRRSF